MSVEHFVEVELDDTGDPLVVRFVCTGGPDDRCRQWCAEGCEEYCLDPPRSTPADPLYFPPGTVIVTGHRWANTGSCREVDWVDAVGWRDSGWVNEPDEGGEREMMTTDLRPGRHLIELDWDGDDYIWRYATPVEVKAQ